MYNIEVNLHIKNMLLAHAPFSYIANEVIQQKKIRKLKPTEQIIIVICSLIFGILPDFDLFFAVIQNLPSSIHHDFLTHYPITYILIWILMGTCFVWRSITCYISKLLDIAKFKPLNITRQPWNSKNSYSLSIWKNMKWWRWTGIFGSPKSDP